MAVYQRQDRNPFLDYGDAPGLREAIRQQHAHNERMMREAREREGVIDLVEINGVWQVPSR